MRHAIADIVFTDDESSLICECGESVHAADQEALNEPYQKHRVDAGERWRRSSSSELTPPGQPVRWRDTATISSHESQRLYRLRHPERVKESQRKYNAKRRGEVAA